MYHFLKHNSFYYYNAFIILFKHSKSTFWSFIPQWTYVFKMLIFVSNLCLVLFSLFLHWPLCSTSGSFASRFSFNALSISNNFWNNFRMNFGVGLSSFSFSSNAKALASINVKTRATKVDVLVPIFSSIHSKFNRVPLKISQCSIVC